MSNVDLSRRNDEKMGLKRGMKEVKSQVFHKITPYGGAAP